MNTQIENTIEEGLKALQDQQYGKADTLLREALKKAQESHNELMMAACFDSIGEISFQQGWFEQSESHFEKALEIRRKKLPAGHQDIVSSLNNLSAAYFFQGKYRLAKPLCEQLVATYEVVLGKEHPEVATCLINLGLIAMAEGKLGNAEQRFAEANGIRQTFYEPMHVLIGNSLSHLGNAYFEQKRFDQASEKFKEALTILEKHYELDNSDLQAVANKLIQSLEHANKFDELERIYLGLISSTELKLGPAHPEVTKHLEKLANLNIKQNKYEGAEKIYQRLLAMKKRAFGDMHPEIASQLTNLALMKQAAGNSAQAENLFLQVLNIYENYKYKSSTGVVSTFPRYLEAVKHLAAFYESDKRYSKSEKQWQNLLKLVEPQVMVYPKLYLDSSEHLIHTLIEQKKLEEAYALLQKAFKFLEQNANNEKLDKDSSKLRQARLMTKTADILKIENKYSEAEFHYKTALENLMKSLGPNHPALAPTMEGYADLLIRTYREPEAEHMLSCAKALLKKT